MVSFVPGFIMAGAECSAMAFAYKMLLPCLSGGGGDDAFSLCCVVGAGLSMGLMTIMEPAYLIGR